MPNNSKELYVTYYCLTPALTITLSDILSHMTYVGLDALMLSYESKGAILTIKSLESTSLS